MPEAKTAFNPEGRVPAGGVRTAAPATFLGAVTVWLQSRGSITADDAVLLAAAGAPILTYLAVIIRNVASMRPQGTVAFLGRALGLVPRS